MLCVGYILMLEALVDKTAQFQMQNIRKLNCRLHLVISSWSNSMVDAEWQCHYSSPHIAFQHTFRVTAQSRLPLRRQLHRADPCWCNKLVWICVDLGGLVMDLLKESQTEITTPFWLLASIGSICAWFRHILRLSLAALGSEPRPWQPPIPGIPQPVQQVLWFCGALLN